ncbi:MAG: hypothetical protein Q8N23_27060 [Archangium sp.]|nr:hypothetical protein [Archangium sp.]MDP3570410.1 hypothetical protein [Archangium sp.]
MIIETESAEEWVKRAALGGGLRVEAGHRPTDDLVKIAVAASLRGDRVTFFGLNPRPLNDLLKIVAAGGLWQGRVNAELTSPGR